MWSQSGHFPTSVNLKHSRLWTAHFQPHQARRLMNMQLPVGWRADKGTSFRFGKTTPCCCWLCSSHLLQQNTDAWSSQLPAHAQKKPVTRNEFDETICTLCRRPLHRDAQVQQHEQTRTCTPKLLQTRRLLTCCTVAPNIVGPLRGTCFTSPFWSPEFWGRSCAHLLQTILTGCAIFTTTRYNIPCNNYIN